jgi:hypothetical protein
MFEDRSTYAPFILIEHRHDPGNYSLILSDTEMVNGADAVFKANGRYGNGYGWSDVALAAMRAEAAALEARLAMDPEAGMFSAYGADLEALKALAALLHRGFHDHGVLASWVRAAPYEYD